MSGALARMLVVLLFACVPRGTLAPRAQPGVEITLYRDHAVVAHRLEVVIPPAAPAKLRLRIAAGVEPDELYLVGASPLELERVEVVGAAPDAPATSCDEVSCVLDGERACCARFERKASEWDRVAPPAPKQATRAPLDVELTLKGPRAGTFAVAIGYDTPRLDWDAAYALTTTASRRRGELRGALAIRNATGIAFTDARLVVVDREHGDRAARAASALEPVKAARPDDTPVAKPRELGRHDLVEGDSRIELIELIEHPLALRSVLVFDPVGPGFDYQHGQPVQDVNLGLTAPGSSKLIESVSFDRLPALRDLPGGPVRVFERKPDGALALLDEARLFGTETLAATRDTIPLGASERVTGKRERRELTVDNDRKRIVEEIALSIDNARDRAVEVLLREHLYRGTGWTIAYSSVFEIDKEGVQQVAMRVAVPPHGTQTVLYVVVYEWSEPKVVKK